MTALPEPGIDGYCGDPAYTAEQMNEFAGQYAIQVLERKIHSLTAARDVNKNNPEESWFDKGLAAGLQVAIDALKLEIPFVKLERGPILAVQPKI